MDFIGTFIDNLTREGKSLNTIKSYASDLQSFKAWFEAANKEPLSPAAVTQVDARGYFNHLVHQERYKPATINRRVIALKRFLEWATSIELVGTNAAKGLTTIAIPSDAPKALTGPEARRLLREAERGGEPRDLCILQLLLDTGLRVSELTAIRLRDLDISERKGSLLIPYTKGGRSRTVPLSKACRDAVSAYMECRPAAAHDRLLCGQRGPMSTSGVFRVVQGYGVRCGVQVSPHVLRHTLATKLLREDGLDIVLVQRLLGHANLNTTARYTQPSEADLAAAVEDLTY